MQIQISWLLQKQTDLDLHCPQRQGVSGFSKTRDYTASGISDEIEFSIEIKEKRCHMNYRNCIDPDQPAAHNL